MTLAYAITSHKCQGETLEQVIIDFSHGYGGKSNIQWGSFYVALTRVKKGTDVYLKTFEESQITFNPKVEEKIAAMRNYKQYKFKKIYLSDTIFKENSEEIKLGYYNMRGFMESNHAKYLDNDHNLLKLHILVISETWLTSETSNKTVIEKLKNWKIIKRLDATDNRKHMGLLLITPMNQASRTDLLFDLDYIEGYMKRNKNEPRSLLYQGIVLSLKKIYRRVVCIYIKQTPNEKETLEISGRIDELDCLIGDLNLNPRIQAEKEKLLKLCGTKKCFGLEENTSTQNSQIDHVLIDKELAKITFATAFHSFASDHRPIAVRFGMMDSQFNSYFLEKIHFDIQNHLRSKKDKSQGDETLVSHENNVRSESETINSHFEDEIETSSSFIIRKFNNPPGRNLCFSNAAVTCVLNIPKLRSFLSEDSNHSVEKNSITGELNRIMKQSTRTNDISTQRLRVIVKSKCFTAGQIGRNFSNNL